MASKPICPAKPITPKSLFGNEAGFSDWLVSKQGIDFLEQFLKIRIEKPVREAKSTNFPCDILAKKTGEKNHIVVIENQLGSTNHDHLAKLLTYAAAHNAMTGIWIAGEVAEDHRHVVNWLNENTPPSISFYLVKLIAYKIGNNPAPILEVVCKPKKVKPPRPPADIKRRTWREAFWIDIQKQMKKVKLPFNLQKPGGDSYASISIGRADFHMEMQLLPSKQKILLDIVIHPKWKDKAFKQLQDQAGKIHGELGSPLIWLPRTDRKSALIRLEGNINPAEDINRKKVCEWFLKWTPKMYLAFKGRIQKLQVPE